METVVQTPPEEELNLLTSWGDPEEPARRRRAAMGTLAFHFAAVAIILLLPRSFFAPTPPEPEPERHVTPIYMPLTTLTQKDPNTAKVSKQYIEPQAAPRQPKVNAPPAPSPQPVRQAYIPPPPPKKAAQVQPLEPPPIDTPGKVPKLELPQTGMVLPPQLPKPQPTQAPLENLGAPAPVVPPDQRKLTMPDTSIDAALRNSVRGGQPAPSLGGSGQSTSESLPQLLSDAQGVDFTDYLRQIRQIVQRQWTNIMPASVRMGRRGTTSVVFSIERLGMVGKLVVVQHAGTDSYDTAAISSVSASQPFPPLPSAFKGSEIRVQFNFAYNAPKQ